MAAASLSPTKACPKCGINRPLDRYYPYLRQCKNCLTAWQKAYYLKNPHKRRTSYTLRPGEYEERFADQGGLCAICGTDTPGSRYHRLVVDHCHATMKIRGLLCHRCNAGLGMFKDQPERLRAAIKYLKG